MLEDRNLIAHTCNERTAERVRAGVGTALQAFREVQGLLPCRRP
jgi:hypothetical protein